MNALTVEGLTKVYKKFKLENISFSLKKGRIMGLIGRNGAGKSTTLKAIFNLVNPNSGYVQILGRDFSKAEAICKQETGVVFGDIEYYQHKRIADITNVTRRFYSNWDKSAYEHYLKVFELDSQKQVHQLSAGMKVKYLISLALSHNARLLVFDEPTSGLDPVARDELLELFVQLVKDGERSILFSTHITSDLDKCADDITYIKDGKILESAEKTTFIESFRSLKEPGETEDLTLEEIMVRTERRCYDV